VRGAVHRCATQREPVKRRDRKRLHLVMMILAPMVNRPSQVSNVNIINRVNRKRKKVSLGDGWLRTGHLHCAYACRVSRYTLSAHFTTGILPALFKKPLTGLYKEKKKRHGELWLRAFLFPGDGDGKGFRSLIMFSSQLNGRKFSCALWAAPALLLAMCGAVLHMTC